MKNRFIVFLLSLLALTALAQQAKGQDSRELGVEAYRQENYEKAASCLSKYIASSENDNNTPRDTHFAQICSMAAFASNKIGHYEEAIKLGRRATDIFKETLGEDNREYANELSNLASYYSDYGCNDTAIIIGTRARDIRKKFGEGKDYAESLVCLATYYDRIGKYNEAIDMAVKAREIYKHLNDTARIDYAELEDKLAVYHSRNAQYQEALKLEERAVSRYRDLGRENESKYVAALSNLAGFYSDLGFNEKAIDIGEESIRLRKKGIGEKKDYAFSLAALANYYDNGGRYKEAIKAATEAMETYRHVIDTMSIDYAKVEVKLAGLHSRTGEQQKALQYGELAVAKFRRNRNAGRMEYLISLNTLAGIYSDLGNHAEAIKLGTEVLDGIKELFGTAHPWYASTLWSLSEFCLRGGENDKATSFATAAARCLQDDVITKFASMNGSDRSHYWDKYSSFYLIYLPRLLYKSHDEKFAETVYNQTALFAKGLLLSAEIEMTRLIKESGDEVATKKYEELRNNRTELNRLLEKPIEERQADADSLQDIINEQERELVKMSKVYGDYTQNMRLTWKDVQECLPDDGIAVEFLSFPVGTDSIIYLALTVRKGYECPKTTVLFEEKDLRSEEKEVKGQKVYMPSEALARLVWQPLEKELTGVNNIYFTPSGKLYNVGIEYLPSMEKRNLYRLSSTRELPLRRNANHNTNNTAALYGGIRYDTDTTTMVAESRMAQSYQQEEWAYNSRSRDASLLLRSKPFYLPATKEEVESAKHSLEKCGVRCSLLTGTKATEESFKALSGKGVRLLHVATHGFYYSPEDAYRMPHSSTIIQSASDLNEEDLSLTRSGLLFSGATNTLDSIGVPEGVDDGILTAKEISQLDLRNMDLVVLSACQTGLGDITQGEGVFGLQRAFKKAGAQTILMSLWKVDDDATQILMSAFYDNLSRGIDKHRAFLEALQHLRTTENGRYSDPQDWAPFIMMDATE